MIIEINITIKPHLPFHSDNSPARPLSNNKIFQCFNIHTSADTALIYNKNKIKYDFEKLFINL